VDHIGVLKQAWRVTWRYKILWLFGLFAAGTSGGGGTGGSNATWTGDTGSLDSLPLREIQRIGWWLQDNIALIAAVTAFLFVLGFALFILSVAAKGGLIFLVNEAEEGRPVRGMDGWAVGFRRWFRVFGIGFVLFVPYTVLVLLVLVATFAPLVAPLIGGGQPGPEAFVGLCGGLALGGFVLLVLGVLLGLLEMLGVRHAVLDDSGVFASIGGAWRDVRVRFKDVFVMWLLTIAVGIAFGVLVGVIAAIFAFGIFAAVFAGEFAAAAVVGVAFFLAMLLPSAIFGAFTSAIWTIFFRKLTGRELAQPPAQPGYAPPLAPDAPGPVTPPAAPYAPAAPPAAPYAPPVAPPPVAPPAAPPRAPFPPQPPEERE
jgi:hypothetical protein